MLVQQYSAASLYSRAKNHVTEEASTVIRYLLWMQAVYALAENEAYKHLLHFDNTPRPISMRPTASNLAITRHTNAATENPWLPA